MKKRLLATLLAGVLVLSSLALVACGNNGNGNDAGNNDPAVADDNDDDPGEDPGEAPADDGEQVTLNFMHIFTPGHAHEDARHASMDEFRAMHPNITLIDDVITHDDYIGQVFSIRAAADELPELFLLHIGHYTQISQSGQAMDWMPVLDENPEWRDSFIPDILAEPRIAGVQLAIPAQMIANGALVYNSDIIASVGWDTIPDYWPEFIEMNAALVEAGYIPIAVGNVGIWPMISGWLEMLCSRILGTDWINSIQAREGARWDDPGFVQVAEVTLEAYQLGFFNQDIQSIDDQTSRMYFAHGEAAMFLDGPWATGAINEFPEAIRDATRVSVLPAIPGGAGVGRTVTGGCAWNYAASAQNEGAVRDAAIKFVMHMTSIEASAQLMEAGFFPPLHLELLPVNWDNLSPIMLEYVNLFNTVDAIDRMDTFQLTTAMAYYIRRGLQEVMLGAITPEEYAANVQDLYYEFLELFE